MPSEITYKDILLYKTEPCRNWNERGVCRYAKRCRYAHGPEELRPVTRSNQYKTKICKAYHENGSCPYGVRCTFIHRIIDDQQPVSTPSDPLKYNLAHPQDKTFIAENESFTSYSNSDNAFKTSNLNVNDIWGCKVGFTTSSCYQPQNYQQQETPDLVNGFEGNDIFSTQLQFLRSSCNSPLYDFPHKSFNLPQ